MSLMTGQFDSDVAAVEPELPVNFTWKGKPLIGSRTAIADSQALADAGIIQLFDFEVLVRVSVFTTAGVPLPVRNDEIQIQDAVTKAIIIYRIDKITPSQDGICLTLGCMQQN